MAVVAPGELLTVYSGNSAPMKLKYEELKQFQDKKGQRRQRFSRAYKQVDRLEVSRASPPRLARSPDMVTSSGALTK